jgi:hypothetical protein
MYRNRPFSPYRSYENSGTRQTLALRAALTASIARNPEYLPGTFTKTACGPNYLNEVYLTDGVEVGLAECVSFLDESLRLLHSGLESEAGIEEGDVLIDGLEVDAEGDVELALLDLLVELDGMADGVVTPYQVQLVHPP